MKKINYLEKINLLDKNYESRIIEKYLYKFWEKNKFFKPSTKFEKSFCIVVPPPNITGNLHIGHAFQQTIIDILIRYKRMDGRKTLCQFGLDHAGIATQIVIENKIKLEEKKNRYDYGRKKFLKKILDWKKESANKIYQQIRTLGISIDWDRTRFTMDDQYKRIVKEVFIRLYHENFIYRKKRLVNWDIKLNTAISDLEIEKRIVNDIFWYIRYPLINNVKTKEGKKYLLICTNRPELIFSDVAIAINPKDNRYNDLIGKKVSLPLINRVIPIIGDEFVDIKNETGCLNISPGHNFHNYDVALRHSLPIINIFTLKGEMRKYPEIINNSKENKISFFKIPDFCHGMDRILARNKIIQKLQEKNFVFNSKLKKTELYYGDRSSTLIEPMLTNQWYIKMKFLAKKAYSIVKEGHIKFISKQYENLYFSWMKKVEDWCISRQLWWGHRIPIWYDHNNFAYVGFDEQDIRKKYKIKSNIILRQEEDVLDTWFSSSLWTFSSLDWLKDNKIFDTFHPTNVLITGFDIIFFWIARMIMLTIYCFKDKKDKIYIPFKKIYITGLIRDKNGCKMSKSKGNVIDPIDIINGISLENLILKRTSNMIQPKMKKEIIKNTRKEYPKGIKSYGADALRFTFAALSTTGRNINLDLNRLNGYHNFCNKIWHASRYVMMIMKNNNYNQNFLFFKFSLIDRWIISVFNNTIKLFRKAIDNYRFDIATNILYEFFWNQFCSWYIEWSKIIFSKKSNQMKISTSHTLVKILEKFLKLAHPIIPFITETIWQKLKNFLGIKRKTIMLESFPKFNLEKKDEKSFSTIEYVKKIIVTIRNIKSENNILLNKKTDIILKKVNYKIKQYIKYNLNLILDITMLNSIEFLEEKMSNYPAILRFVDETELLIPITDSINKKKELAYLEKKIFSLKNEILLIQSQLSNKKFLNQCSLDFIKKKKEKIKKYLNFQEKLKTQKKILQKY